MSLVLFRLLLFECECGSITILSATRKIIKKNSISILFGLCSNKVNEFYAIGFHIKLDGGPPLSQGCPVSLALSSLGLNFFGLFCLVSLLAIDLADRLGPSYR